MKDSNGDWVYEHGFFTPPCVLELYCEGEITGDEIVMLGIITRLSKLKYGCIASNPYLADIMRCSPSTIERSLRNLRNLGLVETVIDQKDGNKRTIYTQVRGDHLSSKMTRGHVKNDGPLSSKMTGYRSTKVIGEKDTVAQSAKRDFFSDSEANRSANRRVVAPTYSTAVTRFAAFSQKMSLHIYRNRPVSGASKDGWTRATLMKWEDRYQDLLRDIDSRTILEVLGWYIEHWQDDYIPDARTFTAFCDKFQKIESAMLRSLNGGKKIKAKGPARMHTINGKPVVFEDEDNEPPPKYVVNGKPFRSDNGDYTRD